MVLVLSVKLGGILLLFGIGDRLLFIVMVLLVSSVV